MSEPVRLAPLGSPSTRPNAVDVSAAAAPMAYEPPAGARPCASVLFLRDGLAGLEVLMLVLAERKGDQRSSAAVFPGGGVDAADTQAYAHCLGLDDAQASARLGLASGGLSFWVAAVREAFEEAGLLRVNQPFDAAALFPWRERLQNGSATLAQLCAEQGFQIDLRGLHYVSHWLTPPGAPKRFDTRFFVSLAPAGQVAQADMREAVEGMWITPQEAMAPARGLVLLPVTRETLKDLARFSTAQQAIDDIQQRPHIPLTMPRRVFTPQGVSVVLPHEFAYAEVGKLDPTGRADVHATITPGRAVRLSPHIIRVTAPNAGAMTGPGTNSYLVGSGRSWTVIDPGPAIASHIQALQDTVAAQAPGARIERIVVTHTHKDHSPGAAPLAAATGAPVWGRQPAHPMWQDESFAPQRVLVHGERFKCGDENGDGQGCTLRVLHTPGHASNHLCYLLEEERILFTGDHVMQGSTVVINPPDGDMVAYLQALESLLAEDLEWLAPGHGFLVAQPHAVVRALIAHRLRREAKVWVGLQALGPASVQALVPQVYDDVPTALHAMAARSLLAHLLKLAHDGRARLEGEHWAPL
jgi:glyoxylase-like metal-dependent hydrolase (beta-lactamase superfamily II)/8-oxo-dGTP pyrophosphatase MutT (NUDIX family)